MTPTKCIAIDVDNTLVKAGRINRPLVNWIAKRKEAGYEVNLWSAAGKAHALEVARRHGVEGLFDAITSKPGYVVDDMGWRWTKWTKVLKRHT